MRGTEGKAAAVAAAALVVLVCGVVAAVRMSGDRIESVTVASAPLALQLSPPTTEAPTTTTTTAPTTTAVPAAEVAPPPSAEPVTVRRAANRAAQPTAATAAPAVVRSAPPATTVPPPPTTAPPRPQAAVGGTDTSAEAGILAAMNADRSHFGLAPLHSDGCLTNLARGWATSMGRSQVMSHNPRFASCNGTAAENVGHWLPCSTSGMEAWWMNSPDHRSNILNGRYNAAGVGVFVDGTGECWYAVDFGP